MCRCGKLYIYLSVLCYSKSMSLRERFYRVYANIPLSLRQEVVLVLEDETISWKIAKLEIDNKTKIGEQVLQKLNALELI